MDNEDLRLIAVVIILLVVFVISGKLNNVIRGIRNKIRRWKKNI